MIVKTWLTENFDIKYPIIMAPMFLVSNDRMLIAASRAGIMGCIPALNYRTPEEFATGMKNLKKDIKGPFGVNLIVNKSNIYFKKHLDICKEIQPDFIITSLGSPEETIRTMQGTKTKIFCDIVDLPYALKVKSLGADAIIAVNSAAGGHAGPLAPSILIPQLRENCSLPIISAGGVGNGEGLLSMMALGVAGISMGSPFIATTESPVGQEYKEACVTYGAKDIVMTTKISGTPCTVINTPYVKKIGTEQNALEKYLNKNKSVKKYVKMLTFYKGNKLIEKAAFSATYKTVWCAGPSIEFVKKIESVENLVANLISEMEKAHESLNNTLIKPSIAVSAASSPVVANVITSLGASSEIHQQAFSLKPKKKKAQRDLSLD